MNDKKNEVDIVEKIKNDEDFFRTSTWLSYTNKYNERLISFMAPWSGCFNIPVVNLTPGDCLKEDSRLVSWNKTQPFFEAFMERSCLCLNYCKDKTNEELKEIL